MKVVKKSKKDFKIIDLYAGLNIKYLFKNSKLQKNYI